MVAREDKQCQRNRLQSISQSLLTSQQQARVKKRPAMKEKKLAARVPVLKVRAVPPVSQLLELRPVSMQIKKTL
jgi:hypothetical protein